MNIVRARDYMIRLLMSRRVPQMDAEDAAHDAIVKALRLGIIIEDKPNAYWARAALNNTITIWRKARRQEEIANKIPHRIGTIDRWAELSEVLSHEAGREALRLSLGPAYGTVPERQRTALHRARRRLWTRY